MKWNIENKILISKLSGIQDKHLSRQKSWNSKSIEVRTFNRAYDKQQMEQLPFSAWVTPIGFLNRVIHWKRGTFAVSTFRVLPRFKRGGSFCHFWTDWKQDCKDTGLECTVAYTVETRDAANLSVPLSVESRPGFCTPVSTRNIHSERWWQERD